MSMDIMNANKYYDKTAPVHATHGNLPHWSQAGKIAFVTFRLADSIPKTILDSKGKAFEDFKTKHTELSPSQLSAAFFYDWHNNIEKYLDRGNGECILANETLREIVFNSLRHFDGERYRMHCFVIMPDHVHLLIEPIAPHTLQNIIHSVKRFSSKAINDMTGRVGNVWQREYFDRLIRDEEHYRRVRDYIHRNPRLLNTGTFTYWQAEWV